MTTSNTLKQNISKSKSIYEIGLLSKDGLFTVLTRREFQTISEAYSYGHKHIHSNKWFSVYVKKIG